MKEVYVIVEEEVEDYRIFSVCASEKAARRKFEELRKLLLEDSKLNLSKRKKKDWDFSLLEQDIAFYEKVTFDDLHPRNLDVEEPLTRPVWKKHKLEE